MTITTTTKPHNSSGDNQTQTLATCHVIVSSYCFLRPLRAGRTGKETKEQRRWLMGWKAQAGAGTRAWASPHHACSVSLLPLCSNMP